MAYPAEAIAEFLQQTSLVSQSAVVVETLEPWHAVPGQGGLAHAIAFLLDRDGWIDSSELGIGLAQGRTHGDCQDRLAAT